MAPNVVAVHCEPSTSERDKSLKMNSIDETALINLVRRYPLLYDLTAALYNEHQKKEEAWNEISILMSASAYDCKTKWTRLRDNYRKALIVRHKNGSRSKDRAVKNEKLLSFLNEKFAFAPRKRNIINLETHENDKSEEPTVKLLAVESTSSQANTTDAEPNKVSKKEISKPVNELKIFFEGISETISKFPKKIQVQMKREIFNLVNDTEASLLDENSINIVFYPSDSTTLGMSDSEGRITGSPNTQAVSNEYADPLQNTDTNLDQFCGVQIKEEEII